MLLTIVTAEGRCDSQLLLETLLMAEGHLETLIPAMGIL
jgi:hypothetical protein